MSLEDLTKEEWEELETKVYTSTNGLEPYMFSFTKIKENYQNQIFVPLDNFSNKIHSYMIKTFSEPFSNLPILILRDKDLIGLVIHKFRLSIGK